MLKKCYKSLEIAKIVIAFQPLEYNASYIHVKCANKFFGITPKKNRRIDDTSMQMKKKFLIPISTSYFQ